MESVDTALVSGLLTGLDDPRFDFLSRLVDDFLDAARVDAAIGDELLERQSRDLATDRIEARHHHRVRRVVDDHIDSCRQLEGANVPAFATDDASLHFIVGERYCRHCSLDALLCRDTLDRQRDDLFRLALCVPLGRLAYLADAVGGVGVRLFFHAMNELRLGVAGGDSGQLLDPAPLFAQQLLELLLALAEGLFAAGKTFGAAGGLALPLLQQVVFAIELTFAVGDAALFPFDFFTAAAELNFPLLTKSNELFLPGQDRGLAQALRFALGFPNDPLGGLFGCRVVRL